MTNNQKKVLETIAKIIGVFAFLYFINKFFFDNKDSNVQTTQQSNQSSVSSPINDEGWQETTGDDVNYRWFTPSTSSTAATANFIIENQRTTYRIFSTCVQEFVAADGTVVAAFKTDTEREANFLETPTGSGNFSVTPWPISEHTKAWKQAKWVRFRPLGGQQIDLKVGRR